MKNVRKIEDSQMGLPRFQFETELVGLNSNWEGLSGGTQKPYRLGTISVGNQLVTAQIPKASNIGLESVSKEVTVVASVDTTTNRTYFTVIGSAQGNQLSAKAFMAALSTDTTASTTVDADLVEEM